MKTYNDQNIRYVRVPSEYGMGIPWQKVRDERSGWGDLFLPVKQKPAGSGMRIVLFGSTTAGLLVLDTLLHFSRFFPGKMDICAVATDDTRDPEARIGIKKRIWKYYSPEEQHLLMDLMIDKACSNGIPCYTGGVKNGYFRDMLQRWNPEAIIMCCFGQKVDANIFEYPVLGMYNFHPSDLASNIGAGARPFESTIREGRTTSFMILHRVTEIIDAGPIVGISPRINIALENGGYPENFLVLQEKIPSVCGWMTQGLLTALLEKLEKGEEGPVQNLDYEKTIPESIKSMLMEPVTEDPLEIKQLPLP